MKLSKELLGEIESFSKENCGRRFWTEEEVALIIELRKRDVFAEGIQKFLKNKGYDRSITAINKKLEHEKNLM